MHTISIGMRFLCTIMWLVKSVSLFNWMDLGAVRACLMKISFKGLIYNGILVMKNNFEMKYNY